MTFYYISILFSLFEFQEVGGLSSLVQARAALPICPVCAALNPSLILYQEGSGINFTYTNPYGLGELRYLKGAGTLKRLRLGLSLSSLYRPGYGEYIFSLGKGFSLLTSFSFGTLLSLYYFSISGYEKDFFFSLTPSLSFKREEFLFSLVLLNLNQPQTGYGEEMPLTILLGVKSHFLRWADFYFDYEREKEERMRLGLKLSEGNFYLGTGLQTMPLLFTGGFGFTLSKVEMAYSLKIHPRLKESHIINLGIRL